MNERHFKTLQNTETQIQKCSGPEIKHIKLGSIYVTPSLPLNGQYKNGRHRLWWSHSSKIYRTRWVPIQLVQKSWISTGFPVSQAFRAWQGTLLALALDQDICQLVVNTKNATKRIKEIQIYDFHPVYKSNSRYSSAKQLEFEFWRVYNYDQATHACLCNPGQ